MSIRTQTCNKRGFFVDGEEENFRLREDMSYLKSGAHAVHHWHMDVEEDDVGLQLDDLFDGFLSVCGLATDLEAMPIQKRADGGSRR